LVLSSVGALILIDKAVFDEAVKVDFQKTPSTVGFAARLTGTHVDVEKGWIAKWPSDATNMNEYSWTHGWQWTSTYKFAGSYGNFDVSQLYDDFFTSYQTPSDYSNGEGNDSGTTNANGSTDTNTIRVNNTSSIYVPLKALQPDGSMSIVSDRGLANNTLWYTGQNKLVDGITYHRVSTNEWVASNYIV